MTKKLRKKIIRLELEEHQHIKVQLYAVDFQHKFMTFMLTFVLFLTYKLVPIL